MKNNLINLLFCGLSLLACTSLWGQENDALHKDSTDFEFGVAELETNYAGFPDKMTTEANRKAYEALKARCRKEVDEEGRKPWEALGELYAWFGDFHLRVGNYSAPYMRREVPSYASMEDYDPLPTCRKVTDRTFLIRFPSCDGDDPTPEWVEESIAAYRASKGIDPTGIAPDVRIPLPLPDVLTDNVDEWTKWVSGQNGWRPTWRKGEVAVILLLKERALMKNEKYPLRGRLKNFRRKRPILHLSFFVLHEAKILHFARSAILHSSFNR